jgi:probable O-glycosylation ligase (exosortase A-associated)
MGTISTYEQDASARGRLNAWQMCINVANDRILGGGFDMYSVEMYALYAPVQGIRLVAHSIYFQMLGEHGYIGLGIFLLLGGFGWRTAARLRKTAKAHPDFRWAGQLAGMCQVSLVGYAVGGAFLSLAYFDLPYDLLAALVIAQRIVLREIEAKQAETGNAMQPAAAVPGPTLGRQGAR